MLFHGINSVALGGCVSGDGVNSPLSLVLNPTGLLACSNGLKYNGPSGGGASSVITSGCIIGSGTLGDPVSLRLDPTGLLECGVNGLKYIGASGGGISLVLTSGCIFGDGVNVPVMVNIDPTGYIYCGTSGIYVDPQDFATVLSSGSFVGEGTLADPLDIRVSSTGYIYTGSSGIYIHPPDFATVLSSGSFTGDGTISAPLDIRINSSGLLDLDQNGILFAGSGGGFALYQTSSTGVVPNATTNPVLKLNHSSLQTVTDIVGKDNQLLVILMTTNTTIQHSSGVIHLWGGTNFKPSGLGGSLTLYHDAGVWKEIARSSY